MSRPPSDPAAEIVRGLRCLGFVVERVGNSDDYRVRAPGTGVADPGAVLALPPALLAQYLEQLSRDVADRVDRHDGDPRDEALSITTVHLAEDLGIYDNGARETTRSIGLLRRRDGRLSFVPDLDIPGGPRRSPSADLEWRAD